MSQLLPGKSAAHVSQNAAQKVAVVCDLLFKFKLVPPCAPEYSFPCTHTHRNVRELIKKRRGQMPPPPCHTIGLFNALTNKNKRHAVQ